MVEVLRTKLFIPRKRNNLVSRPRLVDRINSRLDKKLTLISAPAGFGKTTLLSEWISTCPRRVTWLFLDEGDNDPNLFWTYFIASLQELHTDLGSRAFAQVQSQQPPPIKSILTELINDLTTYSEPFASVLDDYHFIDAQPIHEAMGFLIDHLPGNMHLVITTREDPDLPLARLRARDHLTEIRAMDLRFTQEETDAFLRGVMGLELSQQEVTVLETRTEGWAVGLQLAGLSMQSQRDRQSFIADFSGSHRYILDYLSDEVLRQQPEDMQTFLMQTAILDRLNGPLCDALTGRNDSGKLLRYLEAANLFVIPLDGDRHWYRYHQLFADLLRNQLTRSQPELIPELHRRAGLWFETQGDIPTAVDHALEDVDLSLVIRLIEQHALPKLYRGEVSTVAGWFDRLPEVALETAPMLCINKAWVLVLQSREARWEEVRLALQAAQQALERVKAGEELRKLVAGHAASIQAFIPLTRALEGKNPEKQIALAQEAQQLLPEKEKAIRSINSLNIGVGYKTLADMQAARLAFDQTLEQGISGGNYYAAIYGPINLVECALLLGDLGEALQLCETNIDLFNHLQAGHYFPPIGGLFVLKGIILLEYNQLTEAERNLKEGLDLISKMGEYSAFIKGHSALARLYATLGDRQASLAAIEALETSWHEGIFYTRALRQRIQIRHWPEDPLVRKEAQTWLNQSAIELAELTVVHTTDATSEIYFEYYLNAAHTLARLEMGKPGNYWLAGWLDYLKRQLDFAESHGILNWVVSIAIAQSMLYQAADKEQEALVSLEAAVRAAAPTGLLRVFVDECDRLNALIEKLIPRLTDRVSKEYASRLLEAMSSAPARPEERVGQHEVLSQRELEVMQLLATGLTYEEIGRQLFLSLNTVQFHVKNIYGKLLVNKRVLAIERARELHLI